MLMAPEKTIHQLPIILALGTTQTLAWASSYYLPAILADPIGRDLGVSSNWIFAAFSASLVIAAIIGPRVGRQIDHFGGRPVLTASNLTLADRWQMHQIDYQSTRVAKLSSLESTPP